MFQLSLSTFNMRIKYAHYAWFSLSISFLFFIYIYNIYVNIVIAMTVEALSSVKAHSGVDMSRHNSTIPPSLGSKLTLLTVPPRVY